MSNDQSACKKMVVFLIKLLKLSHIVDQFEAIENFKLLLDQIGSRKVQSSLSKLIKL